MRYLTALCMFALFTIGAAPAAQNIITNPGFESGTTGWSAAWARDAGTIAATVVSSPVRTGAGALHIVHTGVNDWSESPSQNIAVRTGYVLTYSAWIMAASIKGDAQISVVLYDSAGQALNWAYAPASCTLSTGYAPYTSTFIVPDNVRRIVPRIIGDDSCDLYIDDVSLILSDSTHGVPSSYTLQDAQVSATVAVPSFAISLVDKSSGKNFATGSAYLFEVTGIDSAAGSYSFHANYLAGGFPVTVTISIENHGLKVALTADSTAALSNPIEFPGLIAGRTGDNFIVPRASGVIWPVNKPFPFGDFALWAWKSTMPFTGVTDLQSGCLIVSDDPWDDEVRFVKPGGAALYSAQLEHYPAKGIFAHTRTCYLVPFGSGGYASMCQWYRAHAETRGYARTFAQKSAANTAMNRLPGSVDFWIQNGGFQSSGFVDTLADLGIDRAILSLGGGWYDPWQNPRLIDTINAHGLISSRYDIYTDVWPPTHPEQPGYRTAGYPDDIIVNKDGTLLEGWLAYLSGNVPFQGYVACSPTHAAHAEQWISAELDTCRYTGRFIDVELAAGLDECYSTVHPVNRREDAAARVALLDKVKNRFNLVTGGEEARDFAYPDIDFGEGTMTIQPSSNAGYDWDTPVDPPDTDFIKYDCNPALRVPLEQMVYHDVHTATWYTGDGQSKTPGYWDDKDLFNILYGSMPLFMPPTRAYWDTNRVRYVTSYHLAASIFRMTGACKMTNHAVLMADGSVQQTTFENGWNVTVDFGPANYAMGAVTLAAKGFYATDGTQEVYRTVNAGQQTGACYLSDRLFVNPYGAEATVRGLRTSGATLLKRNTDHVALSFIDTQTSVDINPAQLPWPATSFKVYTMDRSAQIATQPLAAGYLRIPKLGPVAFYRLEGDFTPVSMVPFDRGLPALSVSTRAGRAAAVCIRLGTGSILKADLIDLAGCRVAQLWNGRMRAGATLLPLPAGTRAGTYIVRISWNGQSIVRPLVFER